VPFKQYVAVTDPPAYFARAFREALVARGVAVAGPARSSVTDPPARLVDDQRGVSIQHQSPPLREMAATLMKVSQNLYAETLLKTLGASAAAGNATVQTTLRAWGVPAEALIQRDGSGLSRYDYVTPEALVAILTHVDRDAKLRGPFEASLPIAGRDGTLANRMKGTAAEGNARAKTGSMSNVRAVSGYVTTADGEPLVFSILANNFETTADVINRATDAIVVRLAQFTR